MDRNLKNMARAGYVAKGSVYAITGILTFMAAFNMGGQKTGKLQVLQFLDQQSFGNALLILMAVGLACYAAWRFVQSVSDPEGIGSHGKAKAKRFAFFISGIIYLGLAVTAVLRVINAGNSGSGSAASKSSILASDIGLLLLGAAGVAIIIAGIYQFKQAYSKSFMKHFDMLTLDREKRKMLKNSAYIGLCSRGVIFLIIGYFALRAAITSNPSQIKTTADAFAFLQESDYGSWLMGIVAAGLVGYAIYMFMMAKYRRFRG
ncbi:MAG TPA: DUF1206 domain-containing protein [Salinimicrobium sp.]|nr:DUF1206 domain-containing protein [Salinimicrobium sp.]